MNAKTIEAVTRHGQSLLTAFPKSTERDPVALCKKLRRIETSLEQPLVEACDVGMEESELDAITDKAEMRVKALLGIGDRCAKKIGLFVNRDPRGYALKLSDEWTKNYNSNQYSSTGKRICTDWGGYGILAPDLTTEERRVVS